MRPVAWTRTYQAPAVDAAIDRLLPQVHTQSAAISARIIACGGLCCLGRL